MKMESEIKSNEIGVIEKILVNIGDVVQSNENLISYSK